MRRRLTGGLAAWLLVAAAAPGLAAPGGVQQRPRLVVVLVVDQLRADRVDPRLPGGLGRLAREGRIFADAVLAHATTETCAGHATILTGRHPGAVGVVGNRYIDPASGEARGCVEDARPEAKLLGGKGGASPRALRSDALGDWMKQRWPGARVFALSPKDRAAIPLGGRHPDGVFWLDRRGAEGFTTSAYYAKQLPEWVVRFNGKGPEGGFLASLPAVWTHASGAPANGARRDDYAAEAPLYSRTSGHPVRGKDRRETLERFYHTPFLDRVTLDLARRLVEAEGLGSDPTPDLLAISLSATDTVGHLYGPESQEARDALRRLDADLGEWLRDLEEGVGHKQLLVALTADHGVLPLPEWLAETGRSECPLPTGRADARQLGARLEAALASRFGAPEKGGRPWLLHAGYRLTVNRALARTRGVDPEAVAEAAAEILRREPAIAEVWLAREIESGEGPAPFAALYRHSYDPERFGDLAIQPARDCLLTPYPFGTSHGSPYLYDRKVPLILWGAAVQPGVVRGSAATVDLAPTLARLLGLVPPPGLDGRALPTGD